MFAIIKKAYIRIVSGILLMIGSRILFVTYVNFSIDFTGGIFMRLSTSVDNDFSTKLSTYLKELGNKDIRIEIKKSSIHTDLIIKGIDQNPTSVSALTKNIEAFLIEYGYIVDKSGIVQSYIIGPSIGDYMQNAALRAILVGVIFMVIYMLFSFAEIRKFIPPSILAIVTIVTMIFDISIPAGAYGILMGLNPTIQVDIVFVIAILTIMGYSINDTIIIFDRIRENIEHVNKKNIKPILYGDIFEKSIRQSMRRSLGTSISTLIVVLAMYAFGTGAIKLFAFTIGIGIIAGTISSICIAAPLAYVLSGKFATEQKQLK